VHNRFEFRQGRRVRVNVWVEGFAL
jgi:hypothetical protein